MYRYLCFFLFLPCRMHAQENTNTSLKYDYTMLYKAKSASVNQHRAMARMNHDLKAASLSYTVGFASHSISYGNNDYMIDEKLNEFKSFSIGFSYSKKLQRDWSGIVSFQPKLVSNFKGNLSIRDLQPIFFVGLSKRVGSEKASTVQFGIQYSDFFGKPGFLPELGFSSYFSKKIAYTIGFPISEVAYAINSKNSLKAAVSSNSFYTRLNGAHYIQKDLDNGLVRVADLQFRYLNAGVEYDYIADGNWVINVSLNQSFSNDIRLVDQNHNNINIDFKNGINFSMGFKYNLNFK